MSTPDHRDDVTTDPQLDDPTQADGPDEGTSSDWADEGGATHEGPATDSPAAEKGPEQEES